MNRKGEGMNTLGLLLVGVISVIVGLVILGAAADTVYSVQNTVTLVNKTVTLGAANVGVQITGFQALSGITVSNSTGQYVVPASNYTITNFGSNGVVTIAPTTGSLYVNKAVNVSSTTAEVVGYDENAGGRTMAGLIILFGALSIALIFLVILMKEPIIQSLGY